MITNLKNKEKVTKGLSLAGKLVALAVAFSLGACEKCGGKGDEGKGDVSKLKLEFDPATGKGATADITANLKVTYTGEGKFDPKNASDLKLVLEAPTVTDDPTATSTDINGTAEYEIVGKKNKVGGSPVEVDLKDLITSEMEKDKAKDLAFKLPVTSIKAKDGKIEIKVKLKGKDKDGNAKDLQTATFTWNKK